MMNVPASMRSGMMRCFAPCSLLDALHADGGGARAFDLRAHLDQQVGEIDDFRLARAVFHDGLAIGQRRRHQQIFCAGDGDLVENDVSRPSVGRRVAST